MNRNSAPESGGAIFIGLVDIENCCHETGFGKLSILASNFSHNVAEKRGGGVAVVHGNASICESKFTKNIAYLTGGALFSNSTSIAPLVRTLQSAVMEVHCAYKRAPTNSMTVALSSMKQKHSEVQYTHEIHNTNISRGVFLIQTQ